MWHAGISLWYILLSNPVSARFYPNNVNCDLTWLEVAVSKNLIVKGNLSAACLMKREWKNSAHCVPLLSIMAPTTALNLLWTCPPPNILSLIDWVGGCTSCVSKCCVGRGWTGLWRSENFSVSTRWVCMPDAQHDAAVQRKRTHPYTPTQKHTPIMQ